MLQLADVTSAYFCASIAGVAGVAMVPQLHGLMGYGKTGTAGRWTVPHRWFWHYYVFAAVCAAGALAWELVPPRAATDGALGAHGTRAGAPAAALLLVQVLRRLYESIYVAVPSEAPMHVLHYMVGYTFYAAAAAACVAGQGPLPQHYVSTHGVRLGLGCLVFTIASLEQARHHVILARLRGPGRPVYSIPQARLFRFLVAPHYTCEIVIYAALALVGGGTRSQWLCVAAVASMLVISASHTDRWGRARFGAAWTPRWLIFPSL